MRHDVRGGGLRRRMLLTVAPAAGGALGGYLFARYTVDEASFRNLVGMYSAAGAAAGILLLRLTSIFRAILSDYFGKSDG